MTKKNILIAMIGLDGFYWDLIHELCENNLMPFLCSRLKRAYKALLRSTITPYTPAAWTSISTGVNPCKHGVFGFFRVSKSSSGFEITYNTCNDVKYPRAWEMASLFGLKSFVANFPFLYPFNRAVLGNKIYVVPGWETSIKKSYPGIILQRFPRIAENAHDWWSKSRYPSNKEYLNTITRIIKLKLNSILSFINENSVNLIFVVISETDWILHRFGHVHGSDLMELKNFYLILDKFIKAISDRSRLLVITSDHGFKSYKGEFYVNNFLYRRGLLSYVIAKKDVRKESKSLKPSVIKKKMYVCFRKMFNKLPYAIRSKSLLRRIVKENPLISSLKEEYDIDYENSIAFSPEYTLLYIREKSYYDEVLRHLKRLNFLNIVDVTKLCGGSTGETCLPDLIIVPKRDIHVSSIKDPGKGILSMRSTFYHSERGIFLALADNIEPVQTMETISTYDIVPTILSYLNLPIPHDTDGRIIENIARRRKITYLNYRKKWQILRKIGEVAKRKRRVYGK